MSAQVGNGPGAANDRPVKKPNYATDFIAIPKRSRATLTDVVKALSQPERTDAAVFQSTFAYLGTRVFAVFRKDPCTAYPLMYCEPGSARLRLAIEAAGFGTVSAAMLRDALNASKLPSIDWRNFDSLNFHIPQKFPTDMMKCLLGEVKLLGVQS